MRLDSSDASWRIRLGQRARSLVQGVMTDDEKPDGDLLDRALGELDQALTRETARAEALEKVVQGLRGDIATMSAATEGALTHNSLMLGIAYRQIFACRQMMALLDPPEDDIAAIVAKTLEVLQKAEEAYHAIIPEAERRFPEFHPDREIEALEQMEANQKAKTGKGKSPSKNEERER